EAALAESRVDLIQFIAEGVPPRDFIPGSASTIVRGKRHHIAGGSKTGKSLTVGIITAIEMVGQGATVVVLDRENGADEYARRLESVLTAMRAPDQLKEALQ